MLSTFQAVGGTIGVAVLASIAASSTADELAASNGPVSSEVARDALMTGFDQGFVAAAALASLAVLVAALTAPHRR